MNKPILQKTSFGLIRTNPKLTTNIKLITTSDDILYLESLDATNELAKSKYKNFRVSSSGNYYHDLYRFWNNNLSTPLSDAYSTYAQDDSLSVLEKYGSQYDTFYGAGAEPKISSLYTEELSLFSPLWIEPNNIPDYLIIFRTEDPVSVSTKTTVAENDPTTIDLVQNPKYFTNNILNKSKIITSFDLTNDSNLGKYIRKHVNNSQFPESSVYADWERGRFFNYNGMSLKQPGFSNSVRKLWYHCWPNDSTIIEYESIITNGFEQNAVVHPNILNLEFLFDDADRNKYEFYRYFGLYVNKAEYNTFFIDGDALFADRFNQPTQLPIPLNPSTVGYKDNIEPQPQTNINGVLVYAQSPLSSIGASGASFFTYDIVKDEPRIGYLQDINKQFHKIKNNDAFADLTLRLDDTSIDWKSFSGFSKPENYIDSKFNSMKGRPASVINFVNTPDDDDEFRISFTDPLDPAQLPFIDVFTVTASSSLPAGTWVSNLYSSLGPLDVIAKAFADCVVGRNIYYPDLLSIGAVSIGSQVVIFSRVNSSSWNGLKLTSACNTTLYDNIPIKFVSGVVTDYYQALYESSPQPFTTTLAWVAKGEFVGGNDNVYAKVRISADDVNLIADSNYLITKNKDNITRYSKISSIVPYIDQPVYDGDGQIDGFIDFAEYYTLNITNTDQDILLTSGLQCSVVSLASNSCGLLSIYPMKDFDFDFYSTQYMKDADADRKELQDFYLGTTGPYGATTSFNPSAIGPSGSTAWIYPIIGKSSTFAIEGGFKGLAGIGNLIADTDSIIYNEYDRLKENDVRQLVIDSRVVPFVNKWVYDDDGLDVRQNPYRLNTSAAFRYPNFGPSFNEFGVDPTFYTHEWYYLQQYPPYMDFDERKDSFSYFESPINIGSTYSGSTGSTAFGLSTVSGPSSFSEIDLDYFTEYFTREKIGGTAVSQEIKYSSFAYATNQRFAETLFRGVKVLVKPRVDATTVDWNLQTVKTQKITKYNDYKFASILKLTSTGLNFNVIENEKYKTITLVIEAGLMDNLFTKFGASNVGSTADSDYFIDRTLLYTMRDQIQPYNSQPPVGATAYEPTMTDLSGAIKYWEVTSSGIVVHGIQNGSNGTYPNFILEMQQSEDGSYNNIYVPHPVAPPGTLVWAFEGISSVAQNSFTCDSITEYATPPPYPPGTPTTTDLLSAAFLNWQFNPYFSYGSLWDKTPIYVNGGYKAYEGIISGLNFANIADRFNTGDPQISYTTYKKDGSIKYNDKLLELVSPIDGVKANYLTIEEDPDIPQEIDTLSSSEVIGYRMTSPDRAVVNVMSRYNGRYQPKFKDLFYFKDYSLDEYIPIGGGTASINNYGTRWYGFENYLNLEFNLDEQNFGKIHNIFYNKVNPENSSGVLKLNSTTSSPSVFPKIGEIAIDKRDLYSFMSNWDINFYEKNIDRTISESKIGYRGAEENKSFFGSKIMTIPDSVSLNVFSIIDLTDLAGGLSNINNVSETVVESENSTSISTIEKTELVLDVFTTKALTQYLRADGFDTEFNTYINPAFSFGESGLDDDIETYISENILERYRIKNIIFYEALFADNVNNLATVELGFTLAQLGAKGYEVSKNISVNVSDEDPLNFRMIYNIPKLNNYSIAFRIELEKK